MATQSSIVAWRIPWTEESGGLESMGSKESDMTEQLSKQAGCHISSQLAEPGLTHCSFTRYPCHLKCLLHYTFYSGVIEFHRCPPWM